MKRMRFVSGLFIAVLLVIALALPAAVLAQESAATIEAETSPGEAEIENPDDTESPDDAVIPDDTVSPDEPESPDDAVSPDDTVSPGAADIEDLISTVEGLNLRQGIENSLDSKLQNASDSLTAANAGLREDAVSKLQAFINACEAQRDKALTTEQADMLIEMANAIILSL